jgi:hypothetical protein
LDEPPLLVEGRGRGAQIMCWTRKERRKRQKQRDGPPRVGIFERVCIPLGMDGVAKTASGMCNILER